MALADKPCTIRDLTGIIGANNPAEYIRRLRERGLDIMTEWVSGHDRDGRKIRWGVYHLSQTDKQRVLAVLERGHAARP